jgi:hypothetical protein
VPRALDSGGEEDLKETEEAMFTRKSVKNSQEENRGRRKAPEPDGPDGAKKITRNGTLNPGVNGAL